ncbi:MAG: 4Fe-4S binding protein [Planctomycetes bacterium]|nr:4Fe-4S binding protein [Planctomycetota bacterium]
MGKNQHRGRGRCGMGGRGRGCRRGQTAGAGIERSRSEPAASSAAPLDAAPAQQAERTETLAELRQQAEALEQQLAELRSRDVPGAPVVARRVAVVNRARCTACGLCVSTCPKKAIRLARCAEVDASLCSGCGACVDTCPVEAISMHTAES